MTLQYHEKFEVIRKIVELKRAYAVLDSSGDKPHSFLVTSGTGGEGKTTVSIGLALAAAEKNKRVLMVDFNWYSPSLHQYFDLEKVEPDYGSNEGYLLSDSIKPTGVYNIDIMPAVIESKGLSDSLSTKKNMINEFLDEMKDNYQVIVIDSSAAFPMNYKMIDPLSLGSNVDGVVMVTLTNVSPRQALKKACTAFEAGGANLVGVVANHWCNPLSA